MEKDISQTEPVEIPSEPPRPWLRIVLLSVSGLILAGGLVFAGYELRQRQVYPTPPQPPFIPEIPELSDLDETADWKTYANTKYGYTVKYPSQLVLKEETSDVLLLLTYFDNPQNSQDRDRFFIEVDKTKLEIAVEQRKSKIVGHVAEKIENESKIIIGDYVGVKLEYQALSTQSSAPEGFTSIIISNGEYVFTLDANSELMELILPTFKFLKNSLTEDCYSLYKDKEGFGGTYQPGEKECFLDKSSCPCWDGTKNICIPQRHCL